MDLYWTQEIWELLPYASKEFDYWPFFHRFLLMRNKMLLLKAKKDNKKELYKNLKPFVDEMEERYTSWFKI